MQSLHALYFQWRERIRLKPVVSKTIYLTQSLWHSHVGGFRNPGRERPQEARAADGIALCCRIRDEAQNLDEFIEYYLAAGIDHFYFYEKLSTDDFLQVLQPYIDRGLVTLCSDWPHIPISPAAEQDCILRSLGRFKWVGFVDADEFVVIRDGRSIREFLLSYEEYPAVALNWYLYGSNGHRVRPEGPVIMEYTRREIMPDLHVKCFVRPECVAKYRNPHSWYYRRMKSAVNESAKGVYGSISIPASASMAWINHYHHKSDQEYLEKASRKSVQDTVGMKFATRSVERRADRETKANAVQDECALEYYLLRCQRLNHPPKLGAASRCIPA